METNTYTILEEKRNEVEKKLKRLQKKAQKYDIPFSYSEGESYAITLKHKNEYDYIVENQYEVYDLTIQSETIKKDGYTVIAHLEHSPFGNIVNVFEGEIQTEWVTRKPFCKHCNANHNLRYTFMVSNGTEIKQVGRSCLKEYCGIDPQVIGMVNAFYEEIEDCTAEGWDFREPLPCVYSYWEMLALCIDITKEQGYVKTDERGSNKEKLIEALRENKHPSEWAQKVADEMETAIVNMDIETAVACRLNNVQARLKGMFCKPSEFGYFAYAPTAYNNYIERMKREERKNKEREQMGAQSEYVGTVGERYTFPVKEIKLLTSFFNDYGEVFLYRFIDTDGNVLMWFASSKLKDENATAIKATIKAHNERDGVKQTILTRVKVA